MIDWLIYGTPWWLQAAGGAAIIVAACIPLVRLLGVSKALQAASIAGTIWAALTYGRRERQQGWQDKAEKVARDADKAINKAGKARADADAGNAAGRLRDNDGWRRD